MNERVPDEALAGLREMALFTAVKGKLLLQLLDEIEEGRKDARALEMIRKLRRKFSNLPKGTRFRYIGSETVFVVLEQHGCGLVAEWDGPNASTALQGIFAAADSPEKAAELEVYVYG